MKKFSKISFILTLLCILFLGNVYASGDEYIVSQEYSFKNNRKTALTSGCYLEFFVGSGDFVQYQDDESLTISPLPDEIRNDEYGNKYAYYNLTGLAAGAKFNVTIKRKAKLGTYLEMIPARTNTEYLEGNKKFLLPQEGIDSEDSDIISKAKELTEDMPSDYKKAQAIFEFININMTYDTSEAYANKGSVSALKNMRGVCEEFATLFVAMCRAVNIPSRAVVGYMIQEEKQEISGDVIVNKSLINHVWPEIYLQDFGWVPVEPTVIYTVTSPSSSHREAYLDAFCRMASPEYIATGLYNYGVDAVAGYGVKKVSISEKIIGVDENAEKQENKFEDIENYGWAKDAIQFLYELDVVKGYSDAEFGPSRNISRIEFISMFSRVLKHNETTFDEKGLVYYYPDYDTNHWSKDDYDYLMRCYQAVTPSDIVSAGFYNIAEVFGEGALNMNKAITRGEVVALMDVFLPDDYTSPRLTDIAGKRFENSIIKAYNKGLIIGYPDRTFRPNNNITRAEMAVILERYIGNEVYNFVTE